MVIFLPLIRICPFVGFINRLMQRSSVDFPLPDNPIITKNSPSWISKFASFSAMVQSVVFNISFLLFPSFNIRRAFCFSEPKIRYKFLISILFIVYIEFKLIRIGQVKRYKEVASVLFNERIYKIVHRTFFLIIFCETLFCSIFVKQIKWKWIVFW